MKGIKTLLEYRRHLKSRKPDFIRQDAHKRPSLGRKWRRPRGIQSKMRKHLKGYRASVSSGYRSPLAVRSLHRSGLQEVVVRSLADLKAIDPKAQGATIGHVGMRRKMELLQHAMEKKIAILNVKDPQAFLKQAEEERKQRKQEQDSRLQEKRQKQAETEKKAKEAAKEAEKKADAEAPSEEEKRKEQVKEAEKVLTKKE